MGFENVFFASTSFATELIYPFFHVSNHGTLEQPCLTSNTRATNRNAQRAVSEINPVT